MFGSLALFFVYYIVYCDRIEADARCLCMQSIMVSGFILGSGDFYNLAHVLYVKCISIKLSDI